VDCAATVVFDFARLYCPIGPRGRSRSVVGNTARAAHRPLAEDNRGHRRHNYAIERPAGGRSFTFPAAAGWKDAEPAAICAAGP